MTVTAPEQVVVLDFETSGISPDLGERAIEIGAVRLRGGRAVERFQSLMNPGRRISSFIEQYTGITNAMLQGAPRTEAVMHEFAAFLGDDPLVAHNAAFDRRFLDAEFARVGCTRRQAVACSMLAARRIYPEAPNHKLETLVRYRRLPTDGTFHRALADAEMTAQLWLAMAGDLQADWGFATVPFALMDELTRVPKTAVGDWLRRQRVVNGE